MAEEQNFEPTPDFVIGGDSNLDESTQNLTEDINLETTEQNEAQEQIEPQEAPQEPQEEVQEDAQEEVAEAQVNEVLSEEAPVVEEIIEEIEDTTSSEQELVQESAPVQDVNLPEGVDKLVQFINETGGTLEDYINLNRDFDSYSDEQLLMEFYKDSKPHWTDQEIKDHLEDEFSIEDYDEGDELSREDRRKLRLKKEEIFKAKEFLQGRKEKYYENLRLSSQQSATQSEQQLKAQQEAQAQIREQFEQGTQKFFGEGFEGFVFDGGDGKKFRIREQGQKVMDSQIDLNQVLGEHLNEDGSIKDMNSYHQAIYAFQNYNKISQHFYQQGKADALKERAQSTKNIDMTPKTDNSNPTVSNKPKLTFYGSNPNGDVVNPWDL